MITLKPITMSGPLNIKIQLDEEMENIPTWGEGGQEYSPSQRYCYHINICLSDQFQTAKIHTQLLITNHCQETELSDPIQKNIVTLIYTCVH